MVRRAGDLLMVEPSRVLDDDLRFEIRLHREELIALVSEGGWGATSPPSNNCNTATVPRSPYLGPSGELVIPFDCAPAYRWWEVAEAADRTRRLAAAREAADIAPDARPDDRQHV